MTTDGPGRPAPVSTLAAVARLLIALLAFGSLVVVAVIAGRWSTDVGDGRAVATTPGVALLLAAVLLLAVVGLGWLVLAAFDRLSGPRAGLLVVVGTALVVVAVAVAATTRGVGAEHRLAATVACECALVSLIAAASAVRAGRLLAAAARRPAPEPATDVVNG